MAWANTDGCPYRNFYVYYVNSSGEITSPASKPTITAKAIAVILHIITQRNMIRLIKCQRFSRFPAQFWSPAHSCRYYSADSEKFSWAIDFFWSHNEPFFNDCSSFMPRRSGPTAQAFLLIHLANLISRNWEAHSQKLPARTKRFQDSLTVGIKTRARTVWK